MLKPQTSSDFCIVCTFQPFLKWTYFSPILCSNFQCSHTTTTSSINILYSRGKFFMTLAINVVITSSVCYLFLHMDQKELYWMHWSCCALNTIEIVASGEQVIKSKQFLEVLLNINDLVASHIHRDVALIFNSKYLKVFRWGQNFRPVCLLATCIGYYIFIFVMYGYRRHYENLFFYNGIQIVFYYFMYTKFSCAVMTTSLSNLILKSWTETLERTMTDRLDHNAIDTSRISMLFWNPSRNNVEKQLQRCRRFLKDWNIVLAKYNGLVTFAMTFYCLACCIYVPLFYVISSSCLKEGDAFSALVLLSGNVVLLLGLIDICLTPECFNEWSDDILSFLFKYPISKLTPGEAAQVEMLIATLTLQRPVLRASDIFTVGTRLLASISGTVVTYVLVALQFHASWAD